MNYILLFDLIAFIAAIIVLSGDIIWLMLMHSDRLSNVKHLKLWILLWHVPFWIACGWIGWRWGLLEFAIPVRIVQ